ncbi:MAG: hypothetical protein O7J95_05200 [Planctomycetota bacterium]|nr:hypothetical protein [Planctomycetota bacterium]
MSHENASRKAQVAIVGFLSLFVLCTGLLLLWDLRLGGAAALLFALAAIVWRLTPGRGRRGSEGEGLRPPG